MKNSTARGMVFMALSLMVGTGSAQNWNLDGALQTRALTNSNTETAVAIDPATGATFLRQAPTTTNPTVSVTAPAGANTNAVVSVSWSSDNFGGTTTCTPSTSSGATGWSGAQAGSGSLNVTMPGSVGSVTLNMSCTGPNGTANGSGTISVTSPGTGNCGTSPNTPNYFGTPITGSTSAFASTNFGAFPGFGPGGLGGITVSNSLSAMQFLALDFIAPATAVADGAFAMALTTSGGSGQAVLSIAPCPGVFSSSLNTAGSPGRTCQGGLGKSSVDWTINNTQGNSPFRCLLVPGRNYYLNAYVNACDGVCAFIIQGLRRGD